MHVALLDNVVHIVPKEYSAYLYRIMNEVILKASYIILQTYISFVVMHIFTWRCFLVSLLGWAWLCRKDNFSRYINA